MKISIIIPAYNEEGSIKETLENYRKYLKRIFKEDYEIIVVANNCSDNTVPIVRKFIDKDKLIKMINIPGYVGKGAAVMRGFSVAKGEYIGFTDADKSTSPENFFKLYKSKGDFEGIIASRRMKGALIVPKRNLTKSVSSFLFNKLVNLLFNLKFKDTQCGAKLFKKKTAHFLSENCTEHGWDFDVDLLYLCKKNNLKVLEVPIRWIDVETSKLTIKDGLISALKIIRYRIKTILSEKIWKFIKFCFVGGTSALLGLIFFNIFFWFGLNFVICIILSILFSIIYNFSMNRNLTFKARKIKIKNQVWKYGIVYFISQGINLLVSVLTRNLLGEGTLQANIAFITGIAISIPFSFFGSLLWAFRKTKHLNT